MDAEISLGDDVTLRLLRDADADALAEAYRVNRAHLEPWEPRRDETFFTAERQRVHVAARLDAHAAGAALPLVLCAGARIVGRVSLTDIVRGAFQNAHLGYWIAADHQGRGLMTAAVAATAAIARDDLGLHRLQAATLHHNHGSQSVLRACGFTAFGDAPRYLRIAGRWQDHLLFQRILAP